MNRFRYFPKIFYLVEVILAYSGIVLKRYTWGRAVAFALSLVGLFLLNQQKTFTVAVVYTAVSCLGYPLFLYITFKKGGLKERWLKKWGKQKAYQYYESIICMVFFHAGSSVVYFNQVFASHDFSTLFGSLSVSTVGYLFFAIGLFCKLASLYATGVGIYYYRDMFISEKIVPFQVNGLYKYFTNPMYGVGHLHAYGLALLSDSFHAFLLAVFNQVAIFAFYYLLERPFVHSFYLKK